MLSKSNTNHCSLAQSFREMQHMLYTCLQKVPNPFKSKLWNRAEQSQDAEIFTGV